VGGSARLRRLGRVRVRQGIPARRADWTDDGDQRDHRQLKHRAQGETRIVPMDPELAKIRLADMPDYASLEAACGPLRPVLPVDTADAEELDRLLAMAGRKAIGSLAAALDLVFHQVREAAGGLDGSAASYAFARRTLTAGRGGSWESELLEQVIASHRGPVAPDTNPRRIRLHRLLQAPVFQVGALRPFPRMIADAAPAVARVSSQRRRSPGSFVTREHSTGRGI
jgi:hypothetical protein